MPLFLGLGVEVVEPSELDLVLCQMPKETLAFSVLDGVVSASIFD